MFNLGNLIQTAIISMGVANVTPICDKKAENVVNTYTIQLNEFRTQTLNNYNETVNNYDTNYNQYNTGDLYDVKWTVGQTSAYLNIDAYRYTTGVYKAAEDTPENQTINYIRAENEIDDFNKDNYPSSQTVYVFKITPYNYNINTEIDIQIVTQVEGFELYQWNEIMLNHVYCYNAVYSTVQENWDTYLNKQLVKNTTETIIKDIENINNGFYYSKTEDLTEFTYQNSRYELTLNLTLEIVPNVDNYFVINLAPVIDAYEVHAGQTDIEWQYKNVMTHNGDMSIFPPTITGTNVIADATNYEVIDLPGLMFEILAMPFAFVSQAFNLTLFPGTPYQVNISNLFLSIIAIFVFIWLITLFLKMKG